MMKEIKLLSLEKHKFDHWDITISMAFFLQNPDYQDSEAWIKTQFFSAKTNSLCVKFSFQMLMDGVKIVLTEKYEFENRHE